MPVRAARVVGGGPFSRRRALSWAMIWRAALWRREEGAAAGLDGARDSWASICCASFLRDLIWDGDNLRGVFLAGIVVTMIVSFIFRFRRP